VQLADSVATFFFAGVASFAVLFVTHRYGLPASLVDALVPVLAVGIVAGNLLGGRVADRMAASRGGGARLHLASGCQLAAAAILAGALLQSSVVAGGLLLFAGAAVLGAAGPCLDAVRMDVLPSRIRGRSEAARGLLTLGAGALGPLVFGLLAGSSASRNEGLALRDAFLWMLLPLVSSSLVLLVAVRHYRSDSVAAGLPGEVPALPGEVAALPGEVAALPGEVAALPGGVTALPGEVPALPGEIAGLPGAKTGVAVEAGMLGV
jgi:hypothetical protein